MLNLRFLDSQYAQLKVDFKSQIFPRMRDIIIDTYLASRKELSQKQKYHQFEFFGYDFLIDEDFRVWLIEVNENPYLGQPNSYIKETLPKMLDDMTELVLKSYFGPTFHKL